MGSRPERWHQPGWLCPAPGRVPCPAGSPGRTQPFQPLGSWSEPGEHSGLIRSSCTPRAALERPRCGSKRGGRRRTQEDTRGRGRTRCSHTHRGLFPPQRRGDSPWTAERAPAARAHATSNRLLFWVRLNEAGAAGGGGRQLQPRLKA